MKLTFLCRRDKIGARLVAKMWKSDHSYLAGRNTNQEVLFYRSLIRDANQATINRRNRDAIEYQVRRDSMPRIPIRYQTTTRRQDNSVE